MMSVAMLTQAARGRGQQLCSPNPQSVNDEKDPQEHVNQTKAFGTLLVCY